VKALAFHGFDAAMGQTSEVWFIKNGFLSDRKLRVSKIAWLLGFHEVSAFTNAFKRWTGKTPSQIRTAGAY
jgi:methylphosphotriester-DNA--protein-cysteine methyltransferase